MMQKKNENHRGGLMVIDRSANEPIAVSIWELGTRETVEVQMDRKQALQIAQQLISAAARRV